MFHAFIIICAASATFEVYTDTCFRANDTWGPYKTEENCDIRANQMVEEVTQGILNEPAFMVLNYPEQIYAEGYCEKVNNGTDV